MLDSDQARVVAHDEGPAVVLAGAGSGKTRCTTERAARRLTEGGVPADALVLLTFTNKAAGEMRERIARRLPAGAELPWIGTFHSFGSRLLRARGERIGVPANATLMDSDDAARMLDALLASPFSDRELRGRALRIHEEAAANGLDITEAADLPAIKALCDREGFGPIAAARFLEALRRYEREKRRAGVLDFSDLILLPARLLRRDDGLRERLGRKHRDITVDEAQDTDGAQFRLLRLLTPETRTVLLVGDDDQAIYEWRYARPENLREFIESYDAAVYRLERNYRSTPAIVTGGAALVRHNTARLDKSPYAVRAAPQADTLRLFRHADGEAMADGVAAEIAAELKRGTSPADIAVLYRKNRLSRLLEPALLRHGVPYRVRAGTDLLSFADVRMMLAAGRLAVNHRDLRALARVADMVPGLGAKGVARLAAADGDPLENTGGLKPRAARGIEDLAEALRRLHRAGPEGLLDWCRNNALFRGWLEPRLRDRRAADAGGASRSASGAPAPHPALARLEAVQKAIRRRLQSASAEVSPEERWAMALEVVATGGDTADPDDPRVTLSTVHAAKGLEWGTVHLFAFSDGLMPMTRDAGSAAPEEERRLAYVALTRARDRILLHHADRLDTGGAGGPEKFEVSPFLAEIASGQPVEAVDRRGDGPTPGEDAGRPADWLAQMRKAIDASQ